MKRWLRYALALALICLAFALPLPGYSETIVDTLAGATPEMTFSVFGTSGLGISSEQLVGPQFLLMQRIKVTEIGA